jgi:hypothetical protein
VVGTRHVGGEGRGWLPLCVGWFRLLLEDVRAFRDGMPGPGEG